MKAFTFNEAVKDYMDFLSASTRIRKRSYQYVGSCNDLIAKVESHFGTRRSGRDQVYFVYQGYTMVLEVINVSKFSLCLNY